MTSNYLTGDLPGGYPPSLALFAPAHSDINGVASCRNENRGKALITQHLMSDFPTGNPCRGSTRPDGERQQLQRYRNPLEPSAVTSSPWIRVRERDMLPTTSDGLRQSRSSDEGLTRRTKLEFVRHAAHHPSRPSGPSTTSHRSLHRSAQHLAAFGSSCVFTTSRRQTRMRTATHAARISEQHRNTTFTGHYPCADPAQPSSKEEATT